MRAGCRADEALLLPIASSSSSVSLVGSSSSDKDGSALRCTRVLVMVVATVVVLVSLDYIFSTAFGIIPFDASTINGKLYYVSAGYVFHFIRY